MKRTNEMIFEDVRANGLLTEKDILLALEKEDRSFAGKTMPPEGLFLEKTNYNFRRKK